MARLAAAPKGAVDLRITPLLCPTSLSNVADPDSDAELPKVPPEAQPRTRKARAREEATPAPAESDAEAPAANDELPEKQGPVEDGFFNFDEMEKFTALADSGKMRLDEDADDSDFDALELGDNTEDVKNMKFADFFAPIDVGGEKKGARTIDDSLEGKLGAMGATAHAGHENSDEDENDGLQDDGNDLSDEEKELEEQIKQLQAEGDESGDDDEMGEEEDVGGDPVGEGSESDDEDAEKADATKNSTSSNLYELDARLKSLEDEVTKLEEEQLQEKHWSLRGEVSAKQRPMNSLLEVHLDQPMTHFAERRAEEAADAAGPAAGSDDEAAGTTSAPAFDIDSIIKTRVWDETFYDVVRKVDLPPSQRPQGAEDDAVETLNFEKSRVGLGDIYAKQYEAEMLGHKTEGDQKEYADKAEAKATFAKLMFKLDQLTNAHFTPRPPMPGMDGKQLAKVPSLKMEETIPLMMSDAQLKAPEELKAPRRHAKERGELDHDERGAMRRANKERRRRQLAKRVEGGELTLAGMRERQAKLDEKNAQAKRERAAEREAPIERKGKLRASQLLEQAAQNATLDVSRKDEVRRNREKRPDGTPSSKRLKL